MTGPSTARLRGEGGYTLTELLVVVAIAGFSMGAVYTVYQATQKTILYATAGEDAQLSARGVLDRFAAELRSINAGRGVSTGAITAASSSSITFLADLDNDTLDSSGNDATLTAAASSGATTVTVSAVTGFTVGEALALADGPVAETQTISSINSSTKVITLSSGLGTSYPVGAIVRSIETVTYTHTSSSSKLERIVGSSTCPSGTDCTLADNITGLTMTYWNGSVPATQITDSDLSSQGNRDNVREIKVEITSRVQGGDQYVSRTMASIVRPRNFF